MNLATTLSHEVLSGNGDVIPEACFFYMVKGLADVKEKAGCLVAAIAK